MHGELPQVATLGKVIVLSKLYELTMEEAPPGTFTPTTRDWNPFTGAPTSTDAKPFLDGSAALVAVTVREAAELGAVNNPEELIVPLLAAHATAVLVVPVTDAENCCWLPGWIETEPGVTVTDTPEDGVGLGVGVGVVVGVGVGDGLGVPVGVGVGVGFEPWLLRLPELQPPTANPNSTAKRKSKADNQRPRER